MRYCSRATSNRRKNNSHVVCMSKIYLNNCAPWFDRPLSVAGRVIVKENGIYCAKLINADRDLLLIPNLAIHMNRDANSGYAYNAQKIRLSA